MKHSARLLCGFLFALLISCAASKSGKEEEKSKKSEIQAPRMVGRIASVSSDRRFVLIQSYGKWDVPTGGIVTTRGEEERVSNLLVTGESTGQFAAADIQSGNVKVGDTVYHRPVVKSEEFTEFPSSEQPTEAQKADAPEKDVSGNVQKNN